MTRPVVLIIEDEPIILALAISFVEDAGYEAITAVNADEAILILEDRTDVRMVFSDNDMPGSMNGLKLANAVRDRWPPIELILTSGRKIDAGELPVRALFFAKPYRMPDIISAMIAFVAPGSAP